MKIHDLDSEPDDTDSSSNPTFEKPLPCGHETYNTDEIPDERLPVNVVCETCGGKWGLTE